MVLAKFLFQVSDDRVSPAWRPFPISLLRLELDVMNFMVDPEMLKLKPLRNVQDMLANASPDLPIIECELVKPVSAYKPKDISPNFPTSMEVVAKVSPQAPLDLLQILVHSDY